jgi:hypothetical protein
MVFSTILLVENTVGIVQRGKSRFFPRNVELETVVSIQALYEREAEGALLRKKGFSPLL